MSQDTKLGKPNKMYDFWTAPWPFWDLKDKAPELYESLKKSDLVVFKVRSGYVPHISPDCIDVPDFPGGP